MSKTISTYHQRFKSLDERFWEKVDKTDSCWYWASNIDKGGYGKFGSTVAHRVAWTLTNGDIGRLQVNHHCDNRSCVNPEHLYLGTQKDNMGDMFDRGRAPCRKGSTNGNSRLTAEKVLEIRMWLSCGYTLRNIAKTYNIGRSAVSCIKTGLTWSHI